MSDPIEDAERQRANAIHRAGRASVELTITDEIFDRLRANAIENWLATSVGQQATREKLHEIVSIIEKVRKALHEAVDNGKVEAFARAQAELWSPAQADRGQI